MRRPKKHVYKELTLDSKGEKDFCIWMEELKRAGYITDWGRAETLSMTDGFKRTYTEVRELKTKTKVTQKSQEMLEPSVYTPDFFIAWSKKAEGVLYQEISDKDKITLPFVAEKGHSVIEIKPSMTFDPNNMLRVFRLNQKLVWMKYRIFVNLIIPESLFKNTFTPVDVNVPVERRTKKPKWKKNTLTQFLKK